MLYVRSQYTTACELFTELKKKGGGDSDTEFICERNHGKWGKIGAGSSYATRWKVATAVKRFSSPGEQNEQPAPSRTNVADSLTSKALHVHSTPQGTGKLKCFFILNDFSFSSLSLLSKMPTGVDHNGQGKNLCLNNCTPSHGVGWYQTQLKPQNNCTIK